MFLREKLSNSIVIKIWSLSIAKVCICCVKCSSFVHIGKMVTVGMLRSMMAHGCLNLLSYKIHLCQWVKSSINKLIQYYRLLVVIE